MSLHITVTWPYKANTVTGCRSFVDVRKFRAKLKKREENPWVLACTNWWPGGLGICSGAHPCKPGGSSKRMYCNTGSTLNASVHCPDYRITERSVLNLSVTLNKAIFNARRKLVFGSDAD